MLSSSILSVLVVGTQVRCTVADLPLSLTPLTSIPYEFNLPSLEWNRTIDEIFCDQRNGVKLAGGEDKELQPHAGAPFWYCPGGGYRRLRP